MDIQLDYVKSEINKLIETYSMNADSYHWSGSRLIVYGAMVLVVSGYNEKICLHIIDPPVNLWDRNTKHIKTFISGLRKFVKTCFNIEKQIRNLTIFTDEFGVVI
jgi:hypothetical protein